MSFFVDNSISTNECDATPPPDIDTIPRTPDQFDSISDVSEPFQGISYPSNAIFQQKNIAYVLDSTDNIHNMKKPLI